MGRLFSSTDDETIKTDILMSITPNIVRNMELPDKDTQAFWSGTEEAYATTPLFVTAGKSTKPSSRAPDKTEVLESMAKSGAAAPAAGLAAKTLSAPTTTATGQPSGAPSVAALELEPSEGTVQVGQEMRVELTAGGIKDLYGGIITLSYDPKVLDFKTASEGTFLRKDGQPTSFLFSNNINAGTVDIYITRIGGRGGVGGSGSLCTLVFQGKSGGTSEITMKSVKLMNMAREQIGSESKKAKVVVK